jgi:replication-associated recombination protein RarA
MRKELKPTTTEKIIGGSNPNLPFFYIDEWREEAPTNLLFAGPSGTGKTTAAMVIANELGYSLHEFNASDERGIDFIRHKIKTLCQTSGLWNKNLILLDEADGLTKPAQEALRRIMETTDAIFILTCNNITSIIPALQSRCTKFTFKPYSSEDIRAYLHLLDNEWSVAGNMSTVSKDYNADELATHFAGDLRAIQKHVIVGMPLSQDSTEYDVAAMQIAAGDWESLHRTLRVMNDNGVTRHGMMHRIHEHVLSIGLDSKQLYTFLCVWGDFVLRMHQWPLTNSSFLDYFVATLYTQETNNKEEQI